MQFEADKYLALFDIGWRVDEVAQLRRGKGRPNESRPTVRN
jgi:hypothetical protein